jgi:dCMP deaminase
MPTQQQLDEVYLGTALLHSKLSKARRKAVGAVLVTKAGVTLTGYNGSATGLDNNLEDEDSEGNLVTRISTLHSELNCILKAAKEGVSVEGSTMYLTMSSCLHCSAMMIQVGIKECCFIETYRDTSGLDLLKQAGVNCRQYIKKEQM